MSAVHASLLAEVQDTILSGSSDKRGEMLRRVTDLFLDRANQLSEQQVDVFDEVIGLLIKKIESKVRIELSARLALIGNAPTNVVRTLAHDDEIAVARPVLTHSVRLVQDDLLAIARTKSQKHVLAISARPRLDAIVTDVLLERADLEIIDNLVANPGAHFSDAGLQKLVKCAETDAALAETLGRRVDVPAALFEQLLIRATEEVRGRLLSITPPERQDDLLNVIDTAADDVRNEVARPRDLAETLLKLLQLQKNDGLNEAALVGFAKAYQYEEMVVALGLLCSASLSVIEPLMRSSRNDGVLIPCRAANLNWSTVQSILQNRLRNHSMSSSDLARAKLDFIRLSQATAQRLLRFWQVRATVAEQERMAEKRARTRRLTLEPGIIEIADNGTTMDCVILDIGTGVLVPDASTLSPAVRLTIPSTGVTYPCKIAWQKSNRIGLSFAAPATSVSGAPASLSLSVTRH